MQDGSFDINVGPVPTDLHIQKWPWKHLWPKTTPCPQVTVHVCMGLKAVQPSGTKKDTGRGPDPDDLCDLLWQHGSQASAHIQPTVESQTHNVALGNSLGPNVFVTLVDIVIHQDQHGPTEDIAHKCPHAPR